MLWAGVGGALFSQILLRVAHVEGLWFVSILTNGLGRGAVDACVKAGCEDILRWDMAETAKGGPFKEIVESDM